MLFESPHVHVDAEEGTATLWLDFPGGLPNALDLAHLRELESALQSLEANRSLHALVVRSARPDGFCAGVRPEVLAGLSHPTDRAAFCWYVQRVFDRLACLDLVSVALIEGPCHDAGFELALACDYRIAICLPDTRLGFPASLACGGGSVRLRQLMGNGGDRFLASGELISGREARDLKLVDIACCERRRRIELRTLLDRIDRRPLKPRRSNPQMGFAAERRLFAAGKALAVATPTLANSNHPIPTRPQTIGLAGNDGEAARLAADAAIRGRTIVVRGDRSLVFRGIDRLLARGFITPLEAEQARGRVRVADAPAGLRRAGLGLVPATR